MLNVVIPQRGLHFEGLRTVSQGMVAPLSDPALPVLRSDFLYPLMRGGLIEVLVDAEGHQLAGHNDVVGVKDVLGPLFSWLKKSPQGDLSPGLSTPRDARISFGAAPMGMETPPPPPASRRDYTAIDTWRRAGQCREDLVADTTRRLAITEAEAQTLNTELAAEQKVDTCMQIHKIKTFEDAASLATQISHSEARGLLLAPSLHTMP
ncbi:hypothetical protein HDU88_007170 [Geranomyces variabilis]|nr:hypothetical protein HDU88_007170 [Geranomyces variabilis]